MNWVKASPSLNPEDNDLFAYRLDFETKNRFDGNIAGQSWRGKLSQNISSYDYQYDSGKRLVQAEFTGGQFGIPFMNYDLNGNILNLHRLGKLDSAYGKIDALSYTYSGNQLYAVADTITGNMNVGDFRDNNSGTDYTYYTNGNLKSDLNQEITNIQYDSYLNKPTQLTLSGGRWVKYFYDGMGTLLKRENSLGQKWTYLGSILYKNDTLYQMTMPEGRILQNNSGNFIYEFEYRDHLGNLRLSYRDTTTSHPSIRAAAIISQTADYMPFGVEHYASNYVLDSLGRQNFTFSNKEKQDDFGLSRSYFGARQYNPTIGRFLSVDGLADHPNQISLSPYNAFWNNPVMYTDPDGNCPSCPHGEEAAKVYATGAQVTNRDGSWTWTGKEWQTNQTTQVSDRQVASAMPVNMAFGMGAYVGLQQTGQFLSSLTTTQGWKDLGQGFVNMAKMGSVTDPEGMMMRAETAMAVNAYANNIPNMTAGEVAYDLGYGSEKVAEAVLTRKVMPVSKASLGLKVLGKADKMTTPMSYAMQGKFGKLPFRVPTPLNGWGTASNDVGSVLTRNLIIPFGRTAPAQYIQKRK